MEIKERGLGGRGREKNRIDGGEGKALVDGVAEVLYWPFSFDFPTFFYFCFVSEFLEFSGFLQKPNSKYSIILQHI